MCAEVLGPSVEEMERQVLELAALRLRDALSKYQDREYERQRRHAQQAASVWMAVADQVKEWA